MAGGSWNRGGERGNEVNALIIFGAVKMTSLIAEKVNGNLVITPILTTFKMAGMWPFHHRWTESGRMTKIVQVEFSKIWCSLAAVLLLTTVIHTLWAPNMLIRLEKSIMTVFAKSGNISLNLTTGNDVDTFTSKQTMVVKVLHPLLICVTSLTGRSLSVFSLPKNIPILINNLNRIDYLLRIPQWLLRKNGTFLMSFYIGFLALNIPLMTYHLWQLSFFHTGWGNAWEVISIFNIFSAFAMELEFTSFCYLVESRLVYVNDRLSDFVSVEFSRDQIGKNLLHSSRADIDSVSELFQSLLKTDLKRGAWECSQTVRLHWRTHERHSSMASLRKAHLILHDVMEQINGIYQLQLLISIFASVSKILFNLYFSIFGFITSSKQLPSKFQRGQMYIVFSWTVYYCLRFFLLVIFPQAAVKQYKRTKGILVKIDERMIDEGEKEEKKMFWDHISGRDFEFSACGLFDLNMALITSTFSSGITYLVIMAQFH